MSSFADRFDSYFGASQDLRAYNECKSYRYEGDYVRYWEPLYPEQLEEDNLASFGPGACRRGELEEYNFEQFEQEEF